MDPLDNPGMPGRRETDSAPLTDDPRFVAYQLMELRSIVTTGFQELKDAHTDVTRRVASLENFRARVEARDVKEAEQNQNANARWVPIALGLMTVVTIVLIAILSGQGGS